MKLTFFATTTMGFESVLAREIKALGISDVQVFDSKVVFEGTLDDMVRANLWLRTAGRIYLQMGQFNAFSFDELYDKTKALPWENWIQVDDAFPVTRVTSRKSKLFSESDSQAIVKKAIVDRLLERHRTRSLPETGATCAVRIQIDKDTVVLSLDTTGQGLNKRGYRAHMDRAPLRETLAAGLLLVSRWRPNDEVLLDPFCGSGTILVEAGLMAKNIAPGLNRTFAAESWASVPKAMWKTQCEAAKAAIKPDAPYRIFGSDLSSRAISIAQKNIALAGLTDIYVQVLDATQIGSRFEKGKIVTNPPYGERLSDQEEVESLYKAFGAHVRQVLPKWSYCILSGHPDFETYFGARSDQHRKVFNGGMQCYFYQYFKHYQTK